MERPSTSISNASSTSTSLRSEPAFVRWVAAEGVSMVGSSVTTVVLPLIVYQATGSAAKTGILFGLRVVPYLLFGLIAGPLADRGNRRRLIIGGNVIEGLLVATIPIAHLFGVLTVAQVYVVALLSATAFVFSDAAVFGAVPALVGPQRLAAANGLLSALTSATEIAGPVIAGILIASIGTTNAVWVDAVSFLAAAAVQAGIRSDFRTAADPDAIEEPSVGTRAQVGRAVAFIRGDVTVRTLLIAGFGNSFAWGIVLGLLVPFSVERLGIPDDDGRIGVLYASLGVGSLIAGAIFAKLFSPARTRFLTPTSLVASGLLAVALSVVDQWVVALVVISLFSIGVSTAVVVGITYRQIAAPDSLRSSINVIGRMISWGGQPFGAAAAAVLAATIGLRLAYVTAGVVLVIAGSWAATTLRPRTSPTQPAPVS